jgi:hypothetical protein
MDRQSNDQEEDAMRRSTPPIDAAAQQPSARSDAVAIAVPFAAIVLAMLPAVLD